MLQPRIEPECGDSAKVGLGSADSGAVRLEDNESANESQFGDSLCHPRGCVHRVFIPPQKRLDRFARKIEVRIRHRERRAVPSNRGICLRHNVNLERTPCMNFKNPAVG